MSNQHDDLKAKILAEVEAQLEVAWSQSEGELTLDEIEEIVLSTRKQVSESLLRGMVEKQATNRNHEIPLCPDCGKRMHPKGQKSRHVRTRGGDTQIQRPYFYCSACRSGHFPPG